MSQTPSSFTPTPYTPSGDASFTPTQGTYKELKPFRFWCQKVLPLVYDDSLSYYELLCKVVDYLNKTMEDVDTLHDDVDNLHTAYTQLENNMNGKYHSMTQWMNNSYTALVNFVNTYFANLDVQVEINNKLDVMASDGTLSTLIEPYVQPKVNNKIDSMVSSGEFANIVSPFVPPAVENKIDDMVESGSFSNIVGEHVYATPLYAANTSGMTEHNAIYLNGSDGYLYRYNGSAFVSTGILYGSQIVQLIGTAKRFKDKLIVTATGNENEYTIAWDGTDYRLFLKNGNIATTDASYTVTIDSNAFKYVVYDAIGNTITSFAFSDMANYNLPQYSILFGLYKGDIVKYDLDVLTYEENYFKETIFAHYLTPLVCTLSSTTFVAKTGRFMLKDGSVTPWLNNNTFTGLTNAAYCFGYDKLNKAYVVHPYDAYDVSSGTTEIIAVIYQGKVIGTNVVVEDDTIIQQLAQTAIYLIPLKCALTISNGTYTLTTSAGRFLLEDGTVTGHIGSQTFTGMSTAIASFLVYEKSTSTFKCLGFTDTALYDGTCAIIAAIYDNKVIGTSVINTTIFGGNKREIVDGIIYVSFQAGKLVATCSSNVRVVIDGSITNISALTANETIDGGTMVNYLCVDATHFYLKNVSNIGKDDLIVAYYTQNQLFANGERVLVNTIKLTTLKFRQNVPINVNLDRLGNHMYLTMPANSSNCIDYGDFIQLKNAVTSAGVSVKKGDYECISHVFQGTLNEADLSGKNVLMIGDSITNRGWIQDYLKAYVPTINFVGTKQTGQGQGSTSYMSEGYPGFSSADIMGSSSPFYNPSSQQFDFGYYCTTNNISADIVTINFGLNDADTNGITFKNRLQTIINSIKTYDADIKVYIIMPFRRRIGAHTNVYETRMNYEMYEIERAFACYQLTNAILIPTWFVLNDNYDYVYSTLTSDYGAEVKGCTDNIHPSQTLGFKSLANIIYSYLGS